MYMYMYVSLYISIYVIYFYVCMYIYFFGQKFKYNIKNITSGQPLQRAASQISSGHEE